MKLDIDMDVLYDLTGSKYKFAGLYFEAMDSGCKSCMTDVSLKPIAYVKKNDINTNFTTQPYLKPLKKYQVAYKVDGIWIVTDETYYNIEEFKSKYSRLHPAHILED